MKVCKKINVITCAWWHLSFFNSPEKFDLWWTQPCKVSSIQRIYNNKKHVLTLCLRKYILRSWINNNQTTRLLYSLFWSSGNHTILQLQLAFWRQTWWGKKNQVSPLQYRSVQESGSGRWSIISPLSVYSLRLWLVGVSVRCRLLKISHSQLSVPGNW